MRPWPNDDFDKDGFTIEEGWQPPKGALMGASKDTPDCAQPIPNMDSPSCLNVESGKPFDSVGLEVRLRVPTNAKSFTFLFNFYTFEFPKSICSEFNDFFVTLMTPFPHGSPDGNISFDQAGNPISVNNSMLQVCKSQCAPPSSSNCKTFPCPLGTELLLNTGFASPEEYGPHVATGWLRTSAPVAPGSEITLRFAIWDSGDRAFDSTVLVDTFGGWYRP